MAAASLCVAAAAQAGEPIPAVPPYTGAYQPQGVDERGLWMEVDEDERKLRDSKSVINDPKLVQYLHDVLCRTVGEDRCKTVRLYVLRDAGFNAFMAPNGMLVVHTGLLLRARNEAEVAAVLGHEFAHFELRHSLLHFKNRRKASDISAWLGVAGALAGTYGGRDGNAAATIGLAVQIAVIGRAYANDRAQEHDADLLSIAYLGTSRYKPGAFADIWTRVMDEADATSHGRQQSSARYNRVAFFSTHPTDSQRASYMRDAADAMPKTGEEDSAQFMAAMADWRPTLLADQIKLNDFEGSDYLLSALAGSNWTADLLFARGELYRNRGNPRDLASAVDFYRAAIAASPTDAAAYRGMGLAQLRGRDPAGADTLKKYLEMQPDAPDRAMISMLLQ